MKWQQAQWKFNEKVTGKLMVDGDELFYKVDIDDDTANRIGAFLENEEAFKYLSPLLRKFNWRELLLGLNWKELKKLTQMKCVWEVPRYSERPGVMERLGKGEKSVERSTLQGAKPGKNDNRMGLYEMLVLTNCILHRTMKDKWHANRDTCDQS
eukprot:Nk52_evm6s265 gene=Nk52_evmTU6s265